MGTTLPSRRGPRSTVVVVTVVALVAGVLAALQVVAAAPARAATYPVAGFGSIPDVTARQKSLQDDTYGQQCSDDDGGSSQPVTSLQLWQSSADTESLPWNNVVFHCEYPAGAPVSGLQPRDEVLVPEAQSRPAGGTGACTAAAPVMVGLNTRWTRGTDAVDGNGESYYTGDAVVDLEPVCGAIGSDGRTYGAITTSWITGDTSWDGSDTLLCQPGEFVNGLQGYADAPYTTPSQLYALGVLCDAPTFDPAVVAATFPQTTPAVKSSIGDITGSDHIPAACGDGVPATGLRLGILGTENSGDQIATTGVTCTTLATPGAPATLDPSGAVASVDPPGADAAQVADCPAGTVLTGVIGYRQFDGSVPIIGGLAGSCSRLEADGTTSYVDGEPVGTDPIGDTSQGAAGLVYCPPDQVVTGLAIAYHDNGYFPTPKGLEVSCSALTLAPTPPAANGSWTTATEIGPNSTTTQALTDPGGALWFKVPVQPSSTLQVTLDQLPADDDLAVFTDIGQSFLALSDTGDLAKLSAEFAGIDVAPTTFSPTTFSPTTFSPTTFSPTTFSPTTFSPTTFSPTTFSPTTFSPTTFSPTTFSPTTFSPTTFSPDITPDQWVQSGRFGDVGALAEAFSNAQTRSLVAVSAHTGLTPESWSGDTYNRAGFYYLRVTGRDGATSTDPVRLTVATTGGPCEVPLDTFGSTATLTGQPGAKTVVVTDTGRFAGATAGEVRALQDANTAFAAAADGEGPLAAVGPVAVVDVADSPRIQALQAQADAHPGCPYAKTLVAQATRDIVNSYRGADTAPAYVVLEGGDGVVPFFRYADHADVAPESGFVPPVATSSASDASLRNDFVLGQDAYGAAYDLSLGGLAVPVPDAAVGRLVESAPEVTAALTAYVSSGGAAIDPTSTLATGYDFLAAGAQQIASTFAAADRDGTNDTLITDQGVDRALTTVSGRPSPDRTWTAADLKQALFGSRHDVVYLAGHFSDSAALAADFSSVVTTADLAAAPAGTFARSLIFSAGCHSGYNLVDGDGIAGTTDPLDWAQGFARAGATLVAGTGYQYGDTDFVKYSNQLYVDFADALRQGSGPVAVGTALVAAKRGYLAGQATLDGVDQKSLLQATVYGLPMQGVDFPTGRTAPPTPPGPVSAVTDTVDPGRTLGLQRSALTVDPVLTTNTRPLTTNGGGTVNATYLTAAGGTVDSTPAAPTVPVLGVNATAPPGTVLRGLGFREGTYTDTTGVTPLTGAPATETNTVHGPFVSSVFQPSRLATPNLFDALPGGGGTGTTRVFVTPAQYVSDAPGSLTDRQRAYSHLGFTAFYSGNVATYGANQPAASAAPTVTATSGSAAGRTVTFSTHVVGAPAAGIAGVWVTWTVPPTGAGRGTWQSVDLSQDASDSTLWTGTITLPQGADPKALRFLVQAVNGVGLVGVDDAVGAYHALGTATPPPSPASMTVATAPPATAVAGSSLTLAVDLRDAPQFGAALAGRAVTFTVGGSSTSAVTNRNGRAKVTLPLTAAPGPLPVTATFAGDDRAGPVTVLLGTVTVAKRRTAVGVTPGPAGYTVTLRDVSGAQPVGIPARTAFLVAADSAGRVLTVLPVRLDATGAGTVPASAVPVGTRYVTAWFGSAATPTAGGGVLDQTDPVYAAATPVTKDLRPSSVVITPGSAGVVAGTPVTFTATVARGGGTATVTDATTFTVAKANGATVPGACSGATCTVTGAGSYTVRGTYLGTTGRATLTVTPGDAAALTLTPSTATVPAGTSRSYTATATDRYGNVVPGGSTTLAITSRTGDPVPGASCGASSCAATTAGVYRVTATRGGLTAAATLTVVPGAPAAVLVTGGTRQETATGTPFAGPLTAGVVDAWDNPVPGVPVRFDVVTGDGSVPATFTGGATSATVVSKGGGVATAPQLTAGSTAGPVSVTATVAGVPQPATFDLTALSSSAARADLGVTSTLTPTTGGSRQFAVTVTNAGPQKAQTVRVAVTLTGGATVTDAGGGRQLTPRLVRFTVGSLAVGASRTFTVTVTPTGTGRSALLVGSAMSVVTDPDLDDNVSVAAIPGS